MMAKVYRNLARTLSHRLKEMNVRFAGISAAADLSDESVDGMITDQWAETMSEAPRALPAPEEEDKGEDEDEDGTGKYKWPMFKKKSPYTTNSTE